MDILKEYTDITNLSKFKTKAIARYYFELNDIIDVDKIMDIMDFSKKHSLKVLFIGGGTNVLFAFQLFEGIIIKNNLNGWEYNKKTGILESMSSNSISDIATIIEKDDGLYLWHRFIGLPGSVGGAVFGNAGCFGLETQNNFKEAKVLNLESGQVEVLSKIDMNFSYRSSILKDTGKYFLISAKFDLSKKNEKYPQTIDNIKFREDSQPKGNTCGSFFKNPSREYSAGYLIESVGLKGKKIGSAYFSDIHANFLMNEDLGSYQDLLNLIDIAKEKVRNKYGIELINEIRIINN